MRLVPRRFRGFPAPRPLTRSEMSRRRRNVIFDLRQVIFALRASEIRLRRVSVSLRDVPCASFLGASGGSPPPLSTPLPPPSPQMSIGAFDSVLLRAPTAGRPCAPSKMGGEQGVWGKRDLRRQRGSPPRTCERWGFPPWADEANHVSCSGQKIKLSFARRRFFGYRKPDVRPASGRTPQKLLREG